MAAEFTCTQCDKSFKFKTNLVRHQRTVHEGNTRSDNTKRQCKQKRCKSPTEVVVKTKSDVEVTPIPIVVRTNNTNVVAFDFISDSPETEDLKIMIEDLFPWTTQEDINSLSSSEFASTRPPPLLAHS